ncbi:MAG: 16S rRNA (cytosine(1402)-N(4))-methyltransferase [Firmicutes bacterium]|nr:16S rRNA (cytosine(1402)-N(4))-methyltransferase [Bacillota bacterium]MDI6707244.1 16S rRNA (cytosine(1402)-N(4))-methyltransferase RsmH [Bacillota bacterium]
MEFKHVSVLLRESITYLNLKPDGVYVDATIGGGGHAREILKHLGANGRLIGIDRDERAIEAAAKALEGFEGKFVLIHGNFADMHHLITELGFEGVDGILMDLGVSSHQLDQADRGFSYMQDAPLDMRMNRQQELTAEHVVNRYPEEDLKRIIKEYGEEKWAGRIASFIHRERVKKPITSTAQLEGIIKAAIPASARRTGPHPAKRTFQAIRIEVNNELGILEQSLREGVRLLNPGGRICVISFHSLEDRRVKDTFKELEDPCSCPKDFPFCVCGKRAEVRVITKKPVSPDIEEVSINPRARSALLRVAEKL